MHFNFFFFITLSWFSLVRNNNFSGLACVKQVVNQPTKVSQQIKNIFHFFFFFSRLCSVVQSQCHSLRTEFYVNVNNFTLWFEYKINAKIIFFENVCFGPRNIHSSSCVFCVYSTCVVRFSQKRCLPVFLLHFVPALLTSQHRKHVDWLPGTLTQHLNTNLGGFIEFLAL